MLLYVMRTDAQASGIWFDPNTEVQRRAFVSRVEKHTVHKFATVEELARQVYQDLGKL